MEKGIEKTHMRLFQLSEGGAASILEKHIGWERLSTGPPENRPLNWRYFVSLRCFPVSLPHVCSNIPRDIAYSALRIKKMNNNPIVTLLKRENKKAEPFPALPLDVRGLLSRTRGK